MKVIGSVNGSPKQYFLVAPARAYKKTLTRRNTYLNENTLYPGNPARGEFIGSL